MGSKVQPQACAHEQHQPKDEESRRVEKLRKQLMLYYQTMKKL